MKKISLIITLFFFFSLNVNAFSISAASAVVIDQESGRVLYSHNAYSKMGMASTTKIMTALIALQSGKIDNIITISSKAAMTEGSSLYLSPGEKVSMRDLLYGLMLNSGNDAAVAIAEEISGNVDEFVKLMNTRAKEMGAYNTNFVNPNGLSDPSHYTTAADLALISREAMKNEDFKTIVSTKTKQLSDGTYCINHNKMLNLYEGATGIKTGFTKSTGRTLVSSAEKDGKSLICVTLNAPDDWNDHKKMLDYVFSSFIQTSFFKKGEVYGSIKVNGGEKESINAVYEKDGTVILSDEEKNRVAVQANCSEVLDAPVKIGQKIGETIILLDGVELFRCNIIADSMSTEKGGFEFLLKLKRVVTEWLLIPFGNKQIV